jgi:intein/homing endonuclease
MTVLSSSASPTKIYVNGNLIGLTTTPDSFYNELDENRRVGLFSNQVSFYYDEEDKEIRVFCDPGRFTRPVFTVDKNNKLNIRPQHLSLTWDELLDKDLIRYIDSNEVEQCSGVSMTIGELSKYKDNTPYKYCEIHPSAMLGVCSAVIPFGEHNQSPRLVYQSSMLKQALGIPVLSYQQRFDNVMHVLHYPQRPLAETKFHKMLKYDDMLTGCNPVVAVLCYGGANQEDSVILNKSSIDRGMFVHSCYKTVVFEENKKTNCSFEKIEIPPKKVQINGADYSKLGPNGIVMKGVPVYKGDVICGRTLTKVQKDEEEEKTDCSLLLGAADEGVVDEVWEGLNSDGQKIVKIKIRELMIPEVGDKMACFDENTDVLTESGWKSVKNVSKEDKVATLQNGENLEYHNPINTFEYDYEGKMYHLESQQLDMMVTPNHKLYVKKRNSEAFELISAEIVFGKRVSHKKNGEWGVPDTNVFVFPKCDKISNMSRVEYQEKTVIMKDWLYFLGIWYAEGWATGTEEHGSIGFAANKKRVQEKLFEVLQNMDIEFSFNEITKKLNIYNKQIYLVLYPLSVGALQKTLPNFVWSVSKVEARCLLEGMLLGDGSKQGSTWSYWTSSSKLAEDVQRLSFHCGWSSNITSPPGRKAGSQVTLKNGRIITSTHDGYRVSIVTTKNTPTVNHGHIHQQNAQTEEWVDFEGKVYCLEVPGNIMYVRRNGKSYWTGNSRSSQKGVCGALLSQEDMPFTAQGIVPDLLMNPHCFVGDSKVSLYSGLSQDISKMSKNGGEFVWTHNKKNGLVGSKNISMGSGGVKKIVKLTFEDGRTIRCTPNHKFYMGGDKWVEAQDISLNDDKILMGLDGVYDKDFGDEKQWSLECSDHTFFMDTQEDREKTLAFARILGYILADGSVCKYGGEVRCPVYFGHSIDIEICKRDVLLLTGQTPKICQNISSTGYGSVLTLNLPQTLSRSLANLEGISLGRRSAQETSWPSFLFDNCPKSVVREFLAGLFGGDGHAPYLNGEHAMEIRFSQSSQKQFENRFENKIQKLCDLLNLFKVDSIIERKRYYTDDKGREFVSIYLIVRDTLKFTEEIGVRYCTEKMCRLTLYKSYKLLQKRVKEQSEQIFHLITKFYAEGNSMPKALVKARLEFMSKNVPLNEYYSLCSMNQIGNRRKHNRSQDVRHFNYKNFPTFKKYIEGLGCLQWFSKDEYVVKTGENFLPTYGMKVLGRVDDGEEEIFCFTVKEFNNFVVEGACVSNSYPSRMTMSQLLETMYGKVGSLTGKFGDATTFSASSVDPVEKMAKILKSYGFQRYGNERMFSGYTGEMLDSEIFIGPTYYQRLKHLVSKKIHSRSRGNMTMLTMQPLEGNVSTPLVYLATIYKNKCLKNNYV